VKLGTKLSLFTIAIIVLVIFTISFSLFIFEKDSRKRDIRENQEAIFHSFIQLARESLLIHDEVLLLNNMTLLKNTFKGVAYLNFMTDGERILYTDKDNSFRIFKKQYISEAVRDGYVRKDNEKIYELSSPVYIDNKKIGLAQIGFSGKYYDNIIAETISKAGDRILVISFISLVVGLSLALLFSKKLVQPLIKLSEGAGEVGKGKLETRIPVESDDEIGMLAAEFNQMTEKLSELDRAKDDFVNAVSHELKTPLAAIEGYVDFLIDAGDNIPFEKQLKALGIMKTSTQRLSKFINDVLDIAKIKASKMYLQKEKCSLRRIAEKVIGLLQSVAKKKDIELLVKIDDSIPEVLVDEERIDQVFTNLIGNALKFTPRGGKITVGAVKEGAGFIKVFVRDTGPGIPKEDLQRIFGQFEQSDGARNVEGQKGTGLGLAISEGIVKSHGGRIWVESEIDAGTTFYFTLPAAQ